MANYTYDRDHIGETDLQTLNHMISTALCNLFPWEAMLPRAVGSPARLEQSI